jgi:hypothetical protein
MPKEVLPEDEQQARCDDLLSEALATSVRSICCMLHHIILKVSTTTICVSLALWPPEEQSGDAGQVATGVRKAETSREETLIIGSSYCRY